VPGYYPDHTTRSERLALISIGRGEKHRVATKPESALAHRCIDTFRTGKVPVATSAPKRLRTSIVPCGASCTVPSFRNLASTVIGGESVKRGADALNHFERQPFYKKFGWTQEIAYSGSNASNTYNALQVQADKRFSSGYEFQAHYTWSKALGYNNDYFAIDPKMNYGIPDSNRKHAFVLVTVMDLTFA